MILRAKLLVRRSPLSIDRQDLSYVSVITAVVGTQELHRQPPISHGNVRIVITLPSKQTLTFTRDNIEGAVAVLDGTFSSDGCDVKLYESLPANDGTMLVRWYLPPGEDYSPRTERRDMLRGAVLSLLAE